jgi:tetratricopeptide (TPR) repeat protein
MTNERRARPGRLRWMLCPILLLSLLGASGAKADRSACSSGYVKDSLDDQIRLYTLCLTGGDLSKGEIAWAFGNRGTVYLRKGDIDRALSDFTKAIEFDPKYALAYYNRAIVYLYRGELDAAEADLTDAIARPPARVRAEAYTRRGVIRMYEGRCAQALPDFDMALKMNRKLAWAYSAKAWLLATCPDDPIRNGAEALKFAQKALSLQDHWKAHDTLAAAYAELGQFEESLRELKVAQEKLAADEQAAQWQPHLQARFALYEARRPFREQPSEALAAGEWMASAY